MNAFEEFGLERTLMLKTEELREIFRQKGKEGHPDHGGDPVEFARLQEAMGLLSHPSTRLRHWLEIEGVEGSLRGALSSRLVDIFAEVGPKLQLADALIREREAAGSHLARALLEGRVQACREELEGVQEVLAREVGQRVEAFERIERGEEDGWVVARELAFLEKWQGQVKERFSELW